MRALLTAVVLLLAACGGGSAERAPPTAGLPPAPPSAAPEPTGPPPAAPSAPPEPAAAEPLRPRTYVEGDRVVMPVTFPDGTTAELVYPPELRLERAELRPYSWGELRLAEGAAQRDFVIYRAGAGWDEAFAAAEPIATYEGAGGQTVELHDGASIDEDEIDYLVFRFGSWTVAVYDYTADGWRMSEDERAAWARSFSGRETDDGFLVLETTPPLFLGSDLYDDGPATKLGFGDEGRSVEVWPRRDCEPAAVDDRDPADGYAIWCLPEAATVVVASGPPGFVRAALDGIEVRNVRPAA